MKLSLTLHHEGAACRVGGERSHLCAFFSLFFPPQILLLSSSLFLPPKVHSHLWPRRVDLRGADAEHKPPPREESHQCHRCDTEGIAVAGSDPPAGGEKGICTLQMFSGGLRHRLLLWCPAQEITGSNLLVPSAGSGISQH